MMNSQQPRHYFLPSHSLSIQRGAALLIALLVLFMVSAIAIAVTSDFQVLMRRTEYQMLNEKNQPLFRALETFARRALLEDSKKNPEADYEGERWAMPFTLPLDDVSDGITIRGQLIDLQGRFNINSLAETAEQTGSPTAKVLTASQMRFIRLLQTLDIEDIGVSEATALTEAVTDWLDDDNNVSGFGGAEDDYYADQTPPSRAANKLAADISELRMVKGMTEEIYRALAPHITVWPLNGVGEININTATPNVLASFNNDMVNEPLGNAELEWLEDIRKLGRFPGLDVFQQGPFRGRNINTSDAGETSNYFLLIAEITQNDIKHYAQAVIYRDERIAKVVSRTISGYALPQGIAKPAVKQDDDDDFELSLGDDDRDKTKTAP
jgi:general secretion pathway protein K